MSDPHWLTGEYLQENEAKWLFGMNRSYFLLGLKTVGMFLFIFIYLTISFLALSVALQCNRGAHGATKVAIFAFMFGPIYLMVNYYFIRLLSKGQDCEFSNTRPFPYF